MKRLQQVLVSWGPLGVFLLALIESAGIPNPGGTDALVLIVTIARPDQWLACAAMAAAGSVLGSLIFYEITRRGGERLLARYASGGRGARFRGWYQKYGLVTVFVAALLPIPVMPFKVFAACAGALSVSRARYLGVLALARSVRYTGLAYLGARLGENSMGWVKSHMWFMIGVAVFLFAALFGLIKWLDRARLAKEAESL